MTASRATAKVSRADKKRLLRIVRRARKGPFNVIMDPTEFGTGAPIDVLCAVRQSGGHDLWDVPTVRDVVPDRLKTVHKRTIKVGVSSCVVNVAHVRSQKPDLGHP